MEGRERFIGRYRADATGSVSRVPDDPAEVVVDPTSGELYRPVSPSLVGPTRIGEWVMVDLRVAQAVPQGTRLYEVCQALGARGACGVVAGTLVVDFLEASAEDRALLLDWASWPKP